MPFASRPTVAPLPEPDPVRCRALADDLRAAEFTSEALRAAWGPTADTAIARGLRGPAVAALGDRTDPLAVLGRLFVLGVTEPAGHVAASMPHAGIEGLVALGLVERTDDPDAAVRPLAIIRPQSFVDEHGEGEWWIASDLDEAALAGPLAEGHVLGVGGASQTLARLQLPGDSLHSGERGLDLGTGCGIQALRLRRGVRQVVATDISERALRFTRLNALLNDVAEVETRFGSLFDPLEPGEQFERIVSNPPFVITPRVDGVPAYEYRDGGLVGDALVAEVVTGLGVHLAPGGVAQLLGNWEYREGVDGLDRVRGWVAEAPVALDAWVIERERLDPLAYAELWIRDGGTAPGTPEYARLMEAWLDDFARRGVTEVGFGYILLHRPPSWNVTLERYERVRGTAEATGADLAASLAAHARLVSLGDGPAGDAALAASVLRVASDVTEARHHRPGEEAPTVIELHQGGGFGRVVPVDPALAALVGASDGDLAVGPLIDAIAQLLEVDPVALRTDLLPRVRELLFTGFLRFAD
ncbi:class I SAM-dependent methyltransferase [Microbacterium sp. ET2]|uniref:N5-glutamine methyltransferase family protein n=1 Tax=Microbacterium albipurpureum TaxID=3050384 RepID=UPI00259CECEC|nr:class I SAM-dependent methyltransferase [Microbacterium sp. ET2 (Ac-2212)]WJL94211.1 class I SAM-dependent methyltransferase [Microbacterium sp. ET2 (Ac-2212)]